MNEKTKAIMALLAKPIDDYCTEGMKWTLEFQIDAITERGAWFGIYCPYHNAWLRQSDGLYIYYPAEEIAQAMIDEEVMMPFKNAHHLWRVPEIKFTKVDWPIPRVGDSIRVRQSDDFMEGTVARVSWYISGGNEGPCVEVNIS